MKKENPYTAAYIRAVDAFLCGGEVAMWDMLETGIDMGFIGRPDAEMIADDVTHEYGEG